MLTIIPPKQRLFGTIRKAARMESASMENADVLPFKTEIDIFRSATNFLRSMEVFVNVRTEEIMIGAVVNLSAVTSIFISVGSEEMGMKNDC